MSARDLIVAVAVTAVLTTLLISAALGALDGAVALALVEITYQRRKRAAEQRR